MNPSIFSGYTDDRHRELDLQHARIDVVEPLRLIRMAFEPQPRHERLVAADDDHHEQVRDHHHVDQRQHAEHDLLLAELRRVRDEVPQFLDEHEDIDALSEDEADVQWHLQPPRSENEVRENTKHGAIVGMLGHGVHMRCGEAPVDSTAA